MKPVVFHLDDFSPEHMTDKLWDILHRLKAIYPKLKVNMFTIPMLCSEEWLQMIKRDFPWIEMHYHGSWHKHKKEWLNRTDIELPHRDKDYFYPCFKAPWWELNQTTATTLNNMGILVANRRHKKKLNGRLYEYDTGVVKKFPMWYENEQYQTWHGHITKQGGPTPTGIEDIWDWMSIAVPRDTEFMFISELNL